MTPESPEALASCHGDAIDESWGAEEFRALLAHPGAVLVARSQGFALARVTLDEAELLSIATLRTARRQGLARAMLQELCCELRRRGAMWLFLEVARDNRAARALYEALGFEQVGLRKGYYARPTGNVDGLVLRRAL